MAFSEKFFSEDHPCLEESGSGSGNGSHSGSGSGGDSSSDDYSDSGSDGDSGSDSGSSSGTGWGNLCIPMPTIETPSSPKYSKFLFSRVLISYHK